MPKLPYVIILNMGYESNNFFFKLIYYELDCRLELFEVMV